MKRREIKSNDVFGLWIVKEFDQIKIKNSYYICTCTGCNKDYSVMGSTLGKISFGCSTCNSCKKEKSHFYKHGQTYSKTWNTWKAMFRRCTDPNHDKYKYYGGRGITIDENWLDKDNGYINFLKDLGEKPLGLELDRIDNNGNYEKNNCRWVSKKENSNNKSTTILITYNNEIKSLKQWSEYFSMNYHSLWHFYKKHNDLAVALKYAQKI